MRVGTKPPCLDLLRAGQHHSLSCHRANRDGLGRWHGLGKNVRHATDILSGRSAECSQRYPCYGPYPCLCTEKGPSLSIQLALTHVCPVFSNDSACQSADILL